MNNKRLDLMNQRFGRLIVLENIKPSMWLCKCDCGEYKTVSTKLLRRGTTRSCGCLRKEMEVEANTTHGDTNSRLYKTWCNMKSRCTNQKSTDYKYYGAKGVKVCEEWLNSYEAFRDWALANGYKEGLTIDRINSEDNYKPINCRWITLSKNSRRAALNRRKKLVLDMIGRVFNELTVIANIGTTNDGHILYKCLCVCGSEISVASNKLKNGSKKSCGCIRKTRGVVNGIYGG